MNQLPLMNRSQHHDEVYSYLVNICCYPHDAANDYIETHLPKLLDPNYVRKPVAHIEIQGEAA